MATGPDGRWIVDPLDGTIAFVAGLPTFGVSIALERRGRLESASCCSRASASCSWRSAAGERGSTAGGSA